MTSENEIALAVLQIASQKNNGIATYDDLRGEIPNYVNLDNDDMRDSETRPGEPMWHQIVRNIQSHHDQDDNYINRGFLEHVPRVGYKITAAGHARLTKKKT